MSRGDYFYCPHCDAMVERASGETHLRRDAESYGDNGPSFIDALSMVGRLLGKRPEPKTPTPSEGAGR